MNERQDHHLADRYNTLYIKRTFWSIIEVEHDKAGRVGLQFEAKERVDSFDRQMRHLEDYANAEAIEAAG